MSRGLCTPHYNQWLGARRRHTGLDFEEWLSTAPLPQVEAAEPCVVASCELERLRRGRLCYYHYNKYLREHPQRSATEWAATQTPFLHEQHFSLAPLGPTLRLEVLYGLQQRDARGCRINPALVRRLVKCVAPLPSLTTVSGGRRAWAASLTSSKYLNSLLIGLLHEVHVGHNQMLGVKPTDNEVWDSGLIKLSPEFGTDPYRYGQTLDFTTISQPWLRTVFLEWARRTNPSRDRLKEAVKATEIASTTLQRRAGSGHDPEALGFGDVDAIVKAMRELRKADGAPCSYSYRRALNGSFFALIEFGRQAGLMDRVPGGFTRHRSHIIPGSPCGDDEPGRAIPEPVIAQLDAHLSSLGDDFPYRGWTRAQIKHMLRTAYVVLRDTGRRPDEVCRLRLDCLHDDDGDVLIWDNFKRRRFNRRLPITSATADDIRDWRDTRGQLMLRPASADYLFPTRGSSGGRDSSTPHLTTADLSTALRTWVRSIPEIHSDTTGKDAKPLPFDRSRIYPYAFRHSYAQRHADAGVDVDVLKELMDHRSVDTTTGYYKVTIKRKRDAVNSIRHLVIDRAGEPAPAPAATVYELRSVAVPFGNCIEPSNVKAGGQACPIRFQCSGCGFYRPDPSYLVAIDQHINSLKAEGETAIAMGADDFVIRNFTDQIEAYDRVRTTMREALEKLDPEDRQQIEDASAVLRRARASQGLRSLPLTVIPSKALHNDD
ncbi:tyrosine-type recombinase/integrase [Mycolicibacterium moriokaense]|uniref:Phage integrase family protein n=1 Tax=Mycolicibacterium moriokaense TaxID=39691 RepID=A0A318HDE7_9MYCO|nr:tyrosine-type recombinase/integrase [Mycolicibacterium moriokaense]PXX06364.1 phage integrase family protein [Mycolicibacterium moriokaense]